MSKLYDVISRLDKIAPNEERDDSALEIPFQPPPRARFPLFRVLLLGGMIILAGLGCLAGMTWWKNSLGGKSLPARIASDAMPAQAKKTPEVSPPVESAVEITVPSTVNAAFSSSAVDEEIAAEDMVLQEEKAEQGRGAAKESIKESGDGAESAQMNTMDTNGAGERARPETKLTAAHPGGPSTVVEPRPMAGQLDRGALVAPHAADQSSPGSLWLYQAEQHRRNGEWAAAAGLFQRVWNISGNTAVANNLAASLIRLNRLEEAREILEMALQKTPDDSDLRSNLQLVRHLAGKGRP